MRPLFIAKLGSPKGRLFQDVCLITGLLIGFRAACFCFLLISNVGFQAFKTEICYAVLDDDDDDVVVVDDDDVVVDDDVDDGGITVVLIQLMVRNLTYYLW